MEAAPRRRQVGHPGWLAVLLIGLPLVTVRGGAQAIQLGITANGMYRVLGSDLAAAGAPLTEIRADRLALTCGDQPVACRVTDATEGRLSPSSAVIFCGQALDTKYTDTNVYWLSWTGGPGPRMGQLPAAASTAPLTSFRTRVHLEENRLYGYLIWVPEAGELDPWFWQAFNPGKPGHVSFDLPHLVAGAADAIIRVAVRGRTAIPGVHPDHHVVAEINGHPLGEARFEQQAQAIIQGSVPTAMVKPTGNDLVVTCLGDTGAQDKEQAYLDWVEVEYDRGLVADSKQIEFALPAGTAGSVTIEGLRPGPADVYRIDSPREPSFREAGPVASGQVTVSLSEGRYIATTAEAYLAPKSIRRVPAPSLKVGERRADLVIIAYDDFCPAVAPLVQHRERQGLRVAVVPISQVYDEFSAGLFTPVAIRDFLEYAYRNWQKPAPRYVLLVGDASYDYRDYLGTHQRNFVPAYPVRVDDSIETPTDAFYVCLDGNDHVPEMLIGRLPARTAEQTRRLCERVAAYETAPPGGDWRRRLLVVADHELPAKGATWFEISSEQDAARAELFGMQADRVYLRRCGVSPDLPADENQRLTREKATPLALRALADGCALFLFQGHGAAGYLSRERVLQSSDLGGIDNRGCSPLGVLVTCFAGAFDDPEIDGGECIAERLLNAPSGLIACIGPTRLGGENIESPLLARLLSSPKTPLGEAFAAAKQDLLGRHQKQWQLAENYNLLGDPLLRVALEVVPPPAQAVAASNPGEDILADTDGNRIADVMEKHAAAGVYQRHGPPSEERVAAFCALTGPPTAADAEVIKRFGGYVLDIVGPPWGMEVVLPLANIAPLVQAMPDLAVIRESTRYGQRVETARVPLPKNLAGRTPDAGGKP